ncbi:hypothetical protein D9M69_680220 [compost metagenome]
MDIKQLLHDTRFFAFEQPELQWEDLGHLPLGLLTKGMHFRQSIDLSFRSRGLVLRRTEPRSVLAEKCFAEARGIFGAA